MLRATPPSRGPKIDPSDARRVNSYRKEVSDSTVTYELEHLRTEHLRSNLRGRAISGAAVTAVSQAVRLGFYMASTMVLARLLSKEDFGLVAMAATLTGFLRMFREGGLSTTTVQKQNITQAQVSNLFWLNVGLGAATAAFGACLAPILAWFYSNEGLIPIAVVLSCTFVLSGSTVQHIALLNRQMRFKAIAVVDVGSTFVGLVVGIVLAIAGWRSWALVWSQVATSGAEVFLTWFASRWRPSLPSRNSDTRGLLAFGASLTFASFLRRIATSADALFVGRVYGEAALGLYTRGLALLMRPLDQLLSPFDSVFIPILSRIQDQPDRYRKTFLDVYSAMALASFPVAGLFLGLSKPLVLTLLGHNWADVVPIFASFSLAALVYPIAGASMWLVTTQGRSKDIVSSGVIFSLIAIGAIVIGLPYGPVGVAAAFSFSWLFVRLPYQFYLVGRFGPVKTQDLWHVVILQLPVWIGVAAAAHLTVRTLENSNPLIQLVVGGGAGVLAAVALFLALPWERAQLLNLRSHAMAYLRRRRRGLLTQTLIKADILPESY